MAVLEVPRNVLQHSRGPLLYKGKEARPNGMPQQVEHRLSGQAQVLLQILQTGAFRVIFDENVSQTATDLRDGQNGRHTPQALS